MSVWEILNVKLLFFSCDFTGYKGETSADNQALGKTLRRINTDWIPTYKQAEHPETSRANVSRRKMTSPILNPANSDWLGQQAPKSTPDMWPKNIWDVVGNSEIIDQRIEWELKQNMSSNCLF